MSMLATTGKKYNRRFISTTPCRSERNPNKPCACNGKKDLHGLGGSCESGGSFCYVDRDANCEDSSPHNGKTASKNACKEPPYLYLGDSKILHLPSFQQVSCNQEFPEKPLNRASAGVVMKNGKKELQVCGGEGMTTCRLWTEDGWVETEIGFNRANAGASTVGGSMIVTGGNHMSSSKIYTEDHGWLEFTSLPVATEYHCQVTVGDSVYVLGGWTGSERTGSITGDTYKLSLSSKQWVKQSSLNTPRYYHGCAEWDGGVLVVGGFDYGFLSTVEKYNPVSNKWFPFTPLPTKLGDMQVLVWDNDLYVFGGHTGSNANKKVYKLKKGGETWETLGVTLENNDLRPVFPAVNLST